MHEQDHSMQGKKLLTGSEEELLHIIELYADKLFQYCFNILCNYHDAQDVLQTVFIKVYQNYSQYTAKSSLSTWLYKIAYHSCIDLIRKKKLTFYFNDVSELQMPQTYESEELSEEVLAALSFLSPKERAILYARAIEELSYHEMAEIYRASEAALRKRYERARKKLLEKLASTNLGYRRAKV